MWQWPVARTQAQLRSSGGKPASWKHIRGAAVWVAGESASLTQHLKRTGQRSCKDPTASWMEGAFPGQTQSPRGVQTQPGCDRAACGPVPFSIPGLLTLQSLCPKLRAPNCFLFVFLGPHPRHMQVPGLGVELELQLSAYPTATATPDLSCVCSLRHSLWQHQILNPLSEAKDGTCILMDASGVLHPVSHNGNSTTQIVIPLVF